MFFFMKEGYCSWINLKMTCGWDEYPESRIGRHGFESLVDNLSFQKLGISMLVIRLVHPSANTTYPRHLVLMQASAWPLVHVNSPPPQNPACGISTSGTLLPFPSSSPFLFFIHFHEFEPDPGFVEAVRHLDLQVGP